MTENQRRARLVETLLEVGRALSGTLDLAEVLGLVLEHLAALIPFDRGALLLRNGAELEIVAGLGFPEAAPPSRIRIPIGESDEGLYAEICRTRRPLGVAEVTELPDWQQAPGLPATHAWLGVPLLHADQVIGMLSLAWESAHELREDEIGMASAFAAQAASALHNARLYAELQSAYARLEQLDRAKSSFVALASHELRTPLALIDSGCQLLAGHAPVTSDPLATELVASISQGVTRMGELVEGMLEMAEVDNGSVQPAGRQTALPQVAGLARDALQLPIVQRRLQVTIEPLDDLPTLEADPEALQRALQQLLGNAIKYTPDGGAIRVSGRRLPAGAGVLPQDGVELVVADTGIGIAPENLEVIFTRFYQAGNVAQHRTSKTRFMGGGPGLGLAIVRAIVEAHGGRVWAASAGQDPARCPGSQFHVALPLKQAANTL